MIEEHNDDVLRLEDGLGSLKEKFNADSNLIRFLALLSPTCPLGRDQGARAVHEQVFKKYPKIKLSGSIAWINMLPGDSLEAALPTIQVLNDRRIEHYYDPNQVSGKQIAISVGWDGHVAWDIYLFYAPGIEWVDFPPKPTYWMHQISDEWAKNDHYHTGEDLKRELSNSLESLLDGRCNEIPELAMARMDFHENWHFFLEIIGDLALF